MSDLVPENPFKGMIRVVKLMNGEELLGIVRDVTSDKITMLLPAKVETAYTKDENSVFVEYIKLMNYAINIDNEEIILNRNAVLYIGHPIKELEKMYETFFYTMKTNPESLRQPNSPEEVVGPEAGLQMLNELFNNEDFVNFVNDLIDSFEGEAAINEILDEEDEENIQNLLSESSISDLEPEEAPKPPKRKKRSRMKPETNEMPFNPDANPNSAEGWSDNPQDYL
jgi:hypothetical protein